MKTKKLKARNKPTRGRVKADLKTALEARAFYRAWMDRIRLRDVAKELGALEKMFRDRAELLTDMVNPLAPAPADARWEALARRDQAMARQLGNLQEKIGWVLTP